MNKDDTCKSMDVPFFDEKTFFQNSSIPMHITYIGNEYPDGIGPYKHLSAGSMQYGVKHGMFPKELADTMGPGLWDHWKEQYFDVLKTGKPDVRRQINVDMNGTVVMTIELKWLIRNSHQMKRAVGGIVIPVGKDKSISKEAQLLFLNHEYAQMIEELSVPISSFDEAGTVKLMQLIGQSTSERLDMVAAGLLQCAFNGAKHVVVDISRMRVDIAHLIRRISKAGYGMILMDTDVTIVHHSMRQRKESLIDNRMNIKKFLYGSTSIQSAIQDYYRRRRQAF